MHRLTKLLVLICVMYAIQGSGVSAWAQNPVVQWSDFVNCETQELTGWEPKGAKTVLTVTDEETINGTCSVLVSGRETNTNGPMLDIANIVSNGGQYTFSVWVRIKETESEGGSVPFRMGFERRRNGETKSSYVSLVDTTVPVGQWVHLSRTSVASSFVYETLERLILYIETPKAEPEGSTSFYFSDFSMTEVTKN